MDSNVETVIKNLGRNNMSGYFAETGEELIFLLARLIPQGATVGCGDSLTLEQLEVFAYLRKYSHFLDKYKEGLTHEEKREIYLENFRAHTFITGTNAVTLKGELFNIDGNGSRVAPMIYGPQQVIVVVGVNKLVENVEHAIQRARQISAPLDARRLAKNTPCVKLGYCTDCLHKERICNDFVLITGQFQKNRIKVIFVGKELGF